MKIAFFSDIHANLPALEAFFRDIEIVKPDALYCLGDLVGYNVWANEVTEEIRKRGIPTIMGNHDEALQFQAHPDEKPNRRITRQIVSPDNKDFLISLPRHLSLSFGAGENTMTVMLVHGSPKSIDDYLVEDYPEDEILSMMKSHQADVVLCGHTHIPYHRVLSSGSDYKHVINIGSVGKPKDGDPRACYALLTIDKSNAGTKDAIKVEFRRMEYDLKRATKAVMQSEFPDEFAIKLLEAN